MPERTPDKEIRFLSGGGEMGELTRTKNWSNTILGDFDQWPQSLRTTLGILLASKFPMFLWWGPQLIQFYNDAYRPSLGAEGKHPQALGQRGEDCWQEIWPVIKPLIDQVMQGGESTYSENQLIPIYRNGKLEDVYWTFSYSAVKDETGSINGVLVVCNETTQNVETLKQIEASEKYFRAMINDAPISAAIFKGKDFVIELANDEALKLWGKDNDVIGKKLVDAMPELIDQPYLELLYHVYNSATPYIGKEDLAYVKVNNVLTQVYVNFIYKPLYNTMNQVDGILTMGYDVTDHVLARKRVLEEEERTRVAVEGGMLGTFDLDLNANEIIYSDKLSEIFGVSFEKNNHKALVKALHPDDLYIRNEAYEKLYVTGILSYEMRVIWPDDSIHWISTQGKLLYDENKQPLRVLGTVKDITSEKEFIAALESSEKKFRNLVMQAPTAIGILRGKDHVVEIANAKMLELWGKTGEEVMGKRVFEGVYEAADQGFEEILNTVYETGERFTAYKIPVRLLRQERLQTTFINVVYEPLYETNNTISGITIVANDVTRQVEGRHALQESEKEFRSMVTKSPIGMTIFRGADLIIEMANETVLNTLWRKQLNEVLGRKLLDVFPELNEQKFPHLLQQVLATGVSIKEYETVAYIDSHDGQRKFYLDFEYAPLFEPDKSISGIMVTVNDVTDKVRARQQIKETSEQLQIVIDASELGTWELDLQTHKKTFSKRYLEIFGFSGTDTPSHAQVLRYIHPDDMHLREKSFADAWKTGLIFYQPRLVWRDGSTHWIEVRGKVFFDDAKKPLKVMGTVRDLTEERLYQQKLEESERRFRAVADTAPVFIWEAGTDMLCHFFNKAWLNFTGRTMEQEMGNGWAEGVHPDDYEQCLDLYITNFKERKEFYMEYRLRRYDGEYRWISDSGVPRYTHDGAFEGYIGACIDIHNRILFEEQLKESESRLRIAALSSELGTWYYEPATEVLSWDTATRELYGIDTDVTVTVALFLARIHPEDRDYVLEKTAQALDPNTADTYDVEYRVNRLVNGQVRWIHAKGKAFFDDFRRAYLFSGTALDITEKRLALEELQESEQKFRLLADSMPQFVWTGTVDGTLNYFNQSVYNYSGLTPAQIYEEGWLQIVHPDDREENMRLWLESISYGDPFVMEHRFRRHDGEYRWQMSRAIAQKDGNGKIQMWVGTSTDIHDRKLFTDELESVVDQRTRELKLSNDELLKSNNELAQFAYVASHDLQEPLRKIQTLSSRILDSESDVLSAKGKDYFVRMQSASKRMQQLILDLLAFSRTNTAERYFETVDLNPLLQNVLDQLKERIEQKKALLEYTTLPVLFAIRFQFEQLLLNMITNALKFSKADVPLKITITATVVDGKDYSVLDDERIYHCMTISDNGIGFEPEFSERIFEVFQRLHSRDAYEGTGIGLAICKKIVENHQGYIKAQGELGVGATFIIYIPQRENR